ncbi:hypothetical protein [Tepidanaerobacter acetatoxydans]|uniref:hypothetical protein n=1 Tax=Tepidanaerobacter acetatoxydans TaxID=499229 RepID=UPI001BD317F4|nr:hypothetical protein [Tepidanaerobacter acetatoxydans]
MKTFSISDNDVQLLKAIRPFMSSKSQELLDFLITTINVFRPEQPNHKMNFEALNTLLTMIHESRQSKKNTQIIEIDECKKDVLAKQAEDIENLLNTLAEPENNV